MAVGRTGTGDRVMTSPDGITWTLRTSAADNRWSSVTYGNGLFVAVAITGAGNRVMTSGKADYISFSANNIYQGGMSIYGNVGIGTANPGAKLEVVGDIISKGTSWTIRTSAADNIWNSVTYGNGLFVAVAIGDGEPIIIRRAGSIGPGDAVRRGHDAVACS